ncbi:methyltransferase protein [Fusarium flagelliforme]|uniref:Methyltransferase protein n=1 Tax=Fusarium flagelliforme TaxID=2675880 RepID=A0A395MZG0_9HYPO|nr:methyltransferase protein [Fusarium flagelliforme]
MTSDDFEYPWEIRSEVERLQKQYAWIQKCINNKLVFAPVQLDKDGLRVLDVGCADGTLLRNLRKQVTPSAQLVGVDVIEAFLPPSEEGLRYELYDLCEEARGEMTGAFDLTHVRFVLPGAAKVGYQKAVDHLSATLAPGGWLQVHEMDFDLQDKPNAGPALKDVCKLFSGVFKAMGMTQNLVAELPGAFKTAGLEHVSAEIVELPMGKLLGDGEATEMSLQPFLLTIPSLMEGAKGLNADVPASVLENLPARFEKEIREQGGVFYTKVIMGQKPV